MLSGLSQDDMELAWKRVKHSHKDRAFITNPFLDSWLDFSKTNWLSQLSDELARDYKPGLPTTCWVPKGNNLCRPGVILRPQDEVVYFLLIDIMLPNISKYVKKIESVALYPRLTRNEGEVNLLEYYKGQWNRFRSESEKLLTTGFPYMVSTDITSFYSNVNIKELISILTSIEVSKEVRDILSECLNTWSLNQSTGIPQGFFPSDIISLTYLAKTDMELQRRGIKHLRYSDDIRIFAESESDARKNLHELDRQLLARGLSLNSSKTIILDKERAMSEVRSQGEESATISQNFRDIYKKDKPDIGPYTPFWEIEKIIPNSDATPGAKRTAESRFDDFIMSYNNNEGEFDKSLFHLLLAWLKALDSPHAIESCKGILKSHPHEAKAILKYFKKFHNDDSIISYLIDMSNNSQTIFEYVIYQIAKWLYEVGASQTSVIKWARKLLYDNYSSWVKSYAIAIIGRYGDQTDLEFLLHRYSDGLNGLEKAEIVHAICRMELSRRNGFYKRVENDGFLVGKALDYVRKLSDRYDILFPISVD